MTEMIETGISWLPKARADWQIVPAWYLFVEGVERYREDDPHLVPSRYYGVVTQQSYTHLTGHRPVSNDIAAKNMKHVEPNDFIISMGSFESGIEHSPIAGKVSNDYRVLRPTGHVLPSYFRWFFKSQPLIEGLGGLTNEIRVGQRIHYSKFATLKLPLPPLQTQRRIADYLDRETGQIDAMIDKLGELEGELADRKRLVVKALLEELRNTSRWIPVKYLVKIQTGTGDTKDAADAGTYPFYVRSQTPLKHNSWEFQGDAVLTAGDGVGVGRVFHLATGRFMAHQRVYVLNDFRNTLPRYFFHMFSFVFSEEIRNSTAKSTVDSVRMRMIADLELPLPPLEEQRRIADHLDEVTSKIDAMLTKVGQLKDLLTERRAALITDVVTGRKDVA